MSTVQTFNDGTQAASEGSMNNVKHIVGYVVVYKYNTKGGGIKGMPVDRDGHFKVYANRQAANRRRYDIGSNHTTVRPIHANIEYS